MMKTFYFNSGVKPWNCSGLKPGEKFINNEKHEPFDCEDVPDNATFLYMCNNPELELNNNSIIVREAFNTRMASKYAYFRVNI